MANPTMGEVLEGLRRSFRSIDLRAIIVALGDGHGWQNAFTVMRFSAKSVDEISAEHDRLKRLYELPDEVLHTRLGAEFQIVPYRGMNIQLSAHTVERFEGIIARIGDGVINVGERAFRVFDPDLGIDLMQEEMDLEFQINERVVGCWHVYYWGRGSLTTRFGGLDEEGNRHQLDRRDLDNQARVWGLPNFQELMERITEMPFYRSPGFAFEIIMPVYARIGSIIPSSDLVKVSGSFHPALGNLAVECSLYDGAQWQGELGDSLGRVQVNPQTTEPQFTQFSHEFGIKDPPRTGSARASLFKLGRTRIELDHKMAPLKSGVLAYNAFTSFVPEHDITEYLECLTSGTNITNSQLFQKFIPKDQSKKIDELIEYVVTYLLGLCQLNPILLSNPQYDVIQGGLQAGSADILASNIGGSPILVSCTMAMPDARKQGMLLAARTAIAVRIGISEELIRPVLITGKPSVSPSNAKIVELGAEDLGQLWEIIQRGDLAAARHLLGE